MIRQQIEYHSMTVFVSMSPQTIYMSGLDPQGDSMDIAVRCLDCDSISQVKEKALDTIYRAFPYSQRPKVCTHLIPGPFYLFVLTIVSLLCFQWVTTTVPTLSQPRRSVYKILRFKIAFCFLCCDCQISRVKLE